jgi:N-acylneuraminate cytidylyltransferase
MNIGFIPARSGSKSILNKNIKDFCGKPLIYWACKALQESNRIDYIFIAIDNKRYEEIINKFNFSKIVFYYRKEENSKDTSSTEAVLLEWLEESGIRFENEDVILLTQCTNPFVTSKDFDKVINFYYYFNRSIDSIISCAPFKRFLWDGDFGVPLNYDFKNRPRRQDFKGCLIENGAFYINCVKNILRDRCRLSGNIYCYEMPEWTQYEIDEPEDWEYIENLFKRKILK